MNLPILILCLVFLCGCEHDKTVTPPEKTFSKSQMELAYMIGVSEGMNVERRINDHTFKTADECIATMNNEKQKDLEGLTK